MDIEYKLISEIDLSDLIDSLVRYFSTLKFLIKWYA